MRVASTTSDFLIEGPLDRCVTEGRLSRNGDRINFNLLEQSSSPEATRPDPWQSVEGELVETDGEEHWRLSQALDVSNRQGAACLRSGRVFTASSLAYLLGCGDLPACGSGEDICKVGVCVASSPHSAPGEVSLPGLSTGGSFALDQQLACVPVPGAPEGDHIIRSGSLTIGSDRYGLKEAGCLDLIANQRHGLICSWTGTGFVPHRIVDGVAIGAPSGYKSKSSCYTLLETFKNGFVTSWDGSQFMNYDVASARPIGLRGGDTHEPVADDLEVVAKDHICAWTGRAFAIFDRANVQADRYGTFDNQSNCHRVLRYLLDLPLEGDVRPPSPMDSLDPAKVTLVDLLGLWRPTDEVDENVGYTLAGCHDPSFAYHLIAKGDDGELLEQCRLDTFYSWGPAIKLAFHVEKAMAPSWRGQLRTTIDGTLQDIRLYMTQSPVATFGYGEVPIRIKMKEDVKYVVIRGGFRRPDCGRHGDIDSTILLHAWVDGERTGLDYILCSMEPVHSFSFGTREHYDEIVKDLRWIENVAHDYKDTELYWKRNGRDQFFDGQVDGHPFSKLQLKSHMSLMFTEARLDSTAKVFFNPNASDKSRAAHFSTRFPIYYNQK